MVSPVRGVLVRLWCASCSHDLEQSEVTQELARLNTTYNVRIRLSSPRNITDSLFFKKRKWVSGGHGGPIVDTPRHRRFQDDRAIGVHLERQEDVPATFGRVDVRLVPVTDVEVPLDACGHESGMPSDRKHGHRHLISHYVAHVKRYVCGGM